MFDLSSMFGEQISALRPHAERVAGESRAYADEVCSLLNRIAKAAEDTPFEEQRIYLTGSLAAVSYSPLGKNPNGDATVVPAGEEWLLETAIIDCTAADGRLLVFGGNPTDVGVALAANVNPIWGPGRTPLGCQSYGGNGVIVQGNTSLWIASVIAVSYKFQFKRRRLTASKPTTAGGMATITPDRTTVEYTETNRHTGTWLPNG